MLFISVYLAVLCLSEAEKCKRNARKPDQDRESGWCENERGREVLARRAGTPRGVLLLDATVEKFVLADERDPIRSGSSRLVSFCSTRVDRVALQANHTPKSSESPCTSIVNRNGKPLTKDSSRVQTLLAHTFTLCVSLLVLETGTSSSIPSHQHFR